MFSDTVYRVYEYNTIQKKWIKNPFEEGTIKYMGYETFEKLRNKRLIDEVFIEFNVKHSKILINFKKEDVIPACEVLSHYSEFNKVVMINGYMFKLGEKKEEDFKIMLEKIKDFNTIEIKIEESEIFWYLYQVIVFKITIYKDDNYYLREQLDNCIIRE